MFKKRLFLQIISLAFFGIVVIVAYQNREHILKIISTTKPSWLIAGLCCYLVNYLFRSCRLWLYTNKSGSLFPSYLKITSIHGFNSYFLPMRSGDLTLPFLLRLHVDIPLGKGSRILVRARMLDISSLGYLLFFSTLLTPSAISSSWELALLGLGVSFVVAPYGAIYMIRQGPDTMKLWISKFLGEEKPQYPKLNETMISLAVWFWIGCTIFCVIRSLAIPLSFQHVWLLVALQLPFQMLPVQGFANTGNHEGGWVLALSLMGVAPGEGLPMALASHAVFILYTIFLGTMALLLPSRKTEQP